MVPCAAPVCAQTDTGTIAGTVRGDDGNRVAGVTITIEQAGGAIRRTATTDAYGRYEIGDFPADAEYIVRAELSGFATIAIKRVAVAARGTATVDFVLQLTILETVAVNAAAPLVDQNQSTVQQTVSDRLVHSLPLAGRNFLPLASLAAGFTGNPNAPSPQGQMPWTNNVLVDGGSHFSKWRSAPRTFYSGYGLEAIKEVRVFTNRFSAEYGEALATVTSAVTRSGDSQFHGSALVYVQDSALNEPPVFASGNPPSNAQRFGLTLGGPISKDRDRTHFLESYEGRRSRGENTVVSPIAAGREVPDNEDEHLVFARVDHRLGDGHVVSSRYNGQWFRWHNERGGLDLPGTGLAYTNDVHTWLTTDRREIGGRWLNDIRFQFSRFVDIRRDLQPTLFVSHSGYSQEGGTVGTFGFGADPEDTWEGADTLSRLAGRHSLRLGGGMKYVRDHNPALTYGRGAYFFVGPPDPLTKPFLFLQTIAPSPDRAVADPRSTAAFGFLQDDVALTASTTLNLGVRYDVEAIANLRNYVARTDANNVQPRIGIAWRPMERTVVRGGAGLYTQQHLLYYINRVQLEGPDGTVALALTPESPMFPTFPSILPVLPVGAAYPARDVHFVDRGFHNPYSVQATAGMERIARGVTVGVDFVYLNGRDLMSLNDVNAPARLQKPNQRSVEEADETRPEEAVPGGFRNVYLLGNLGRSWYHAVQIKAERSIGRLQAMGSYTVSRADDMLNYQIPEDSRNLDAEKARANTDVRHNVTVGATWALPGGRWLLKDWSLAGIGVFRSGRPYTITWGDDRNGTTQNDARPDGRNTAETDGYQNVDLALTRRFPRGSTVFEARVEMFNVFNTTNYDEYVGALLSPFYRQPISAFPKRRMQLAGTIRF